MAQRVGIVEVDLVDLHHGEVALAVLGRADLAFDRVAGAQAELTHLLGADIDVVGARQVVGFHRAQVAETVGDHLDGADAEDRLVGGGELLEDGEHQLLAAHHRRTLDALLFGEREQFGRLLLLEVLEIHGSSIWWGNDARACSDRSGRALEYSAVSYWMGPIELPPGRRRQGSRTAIL